MRGEFSPWRRLWRCGAQTSSGVGKTQHHDVALGHEDIACAVGVRAGREQCKAAPEERMGGIGDFDFRRIVYEWVVDRGIKVCGRSTESTTMLYWPKRRRHPSFVGNSKPGSKRALWKRANSIPPRQVRPRAARVHFLQSCQHGARVFDEHSTNTTAPQLWGWVSGGTTAEQTAPGEPGTTGARRPAWLVERTEAAKLWRCASHLSRAE